MATSTDPPALALDDMRRVFDSAPDAVLITDDERRYTFANAAACALFGLRSDQLVGRRIEEFAAPTKRAEIADSWSSFLRGELTSGQYEIVRPDGAMRFVEFHARPHAVRGGHLSILRELSDAGLSAARLRTLTEALARATRREEVAGVVVIHALQAVCASACAVAVPSRDGAWLEVVMNINVDPLMSVRFDRVPLAASSPLTDAARERRALFFDDRRARDEAYPDPSDDLRGAGSEACAALPIVAASGLVAVVDLRFKETRAFSREDRALLSALAAQCAVAFERAALFREAEETRTQARFLARASELLAGSLDYQATLSAVAALVVPPLADWCLIDVREGERLTRVAVSHAAPDKAWLADELRAQPFLDDPHGAVTRRVIETGEPELVPEASERHPAAAALSERGRRQLDGLGVRSLMVVPLCAPDRVLGAITLLASGPDRTYGERDLLFALDLARRASQALHNALLYRALEAQRARIEDERREAELSNEAKDRFLGHLGHELRNPLAPMLMAVHLMKLKSDEATRREREVIERQIHHLTRLVDDLLDATRIRQGKVQLRLARVEIDQVLTQAIELATPLIEKGKHTLRAARPPSSLAAWGDAERLTQVFSNLLTNAARYTPPGGNISIDAELEGALVVVRVKDDGDGIAAEMLPQIFEPFLQGPQAAERRAGGLGLGLPIARTLVELHGGTLDAESPGPGRGSAFVVRLPAV